MSDTNWLASAADDGGESGASGGADDSADAGGQGGAAGSSGTETSGAGAAEVEGAGGAAAPGAATEATAETAAAKTVPLSALHESRKQFQEERAARQLMERRLDVVLTRFGGAGADAAAAGAAPKAPSVEDNPLEVIRQLKETQDQAQARERRALEERQVIGELASVVDRDERAFRESAPDYGDAVNHLMNQRDQELRFMGVTDPGQRQRILAQEKLQFIASAVQRGISVAEQAYAYAQMRGYQRKAAAPPPTPGQRVEAAARGAAASRAPGGGAAPRGQVTAAEIAKMSDEDFDKLDYKAFRRAAGGGG